MRPTLAQAVVVLIAALCGAHLASARAQSGAANQPPPGSQQQPGAESAPRVSNPAQVTTDPPLGLPPLLVPADNPLTPEKIALGERLYHDVRFSSTGKVSCATCHDRAKGFTDAPNAKAKGIDDQIGTRNSPTTANAAYFTTMFWDGRSTSLEDQSQFPLINPIEMGLKNHEPVEAIVRSDPAYVAMFRSAFGLEPDQVDIKAVMKAVASFERTLIFGNSPFDRWYFGKEEDAIGAEAKRGFEVFVENGRCVSCHTIEQNFALFTDNRFHNIGVGINGIQREIADFAPVFLQRKAAGADVDEEVLSNPKASELGRFAVTDTLDEIGSFKTSTLRNVAATAPYMHDGSIATLREVIEHYNNGGVTRAGDPVNDFLSGGIRPLDLKDREIADLVVFLTTLTSPEFEAAAEALDASGLPKAGSKTATISGAACATPGGVAAKPSAAARGTPTSPAPAEDPPVATTGGQP